MDVPVKKPQDNGQKTLVSDDILARRLKNRERQCRYRERKRLKAGAMKVLGADQLASLPVKVPVVAASQDSALPVNVAPQDSAVPVKVAPLDSLMPVNVAPLDSQVPVKVAPLDSLMAVNVAPLDSPVPVKVWNWKRDARNAQEARQKEVSTSSTMSPDLVSKQSDVVLE